MDLRTYKHDPVKIAHQIRRRVLETALRRGGVNLSQACSSAEIWATLYTRIMNITDVEAPLTPPYFPGAPKAGFKGITGADYNGKQLPESDRIFLSPVQSSIVQYAALASTGRLSEEGFLSFGEDGSVVEHIGEAHSPGMEVSTGSLGQALGMAGGIAMARRMKGETGRQIVVLGDGELELGMTWEAIQAMVQQKLNNVLIIIDRNRLQCDGLMKDVCDVEDTLKARFEAFGCEVYEIDGHNCAVLEAIANQAPNAEGKPRVIMANTNPIKGIEEMEDKGTRIHFVRILPHEVEKYQAALERLKKLEA